MKKIFSLTILSLMIISLIGIVSAETGTIWTTRDDCGDETKNVNHYEVGEAIWINGYNFEAGEYEWNIMGLGQSEDSQASCDPNVIVASGDYTVNETGAFCFDAYVVQNDDCGQYQADFNHKHDTYHVVPEFGVFIGLLTILSAFGVFFIIRRE